MVAASAGQSCTGQGRSICVRPRRRDPERNLMYRKSKMHILQVRAVRSLDRKSVVEGGDAHALCCAVRRTKLACMAPGRSVPWKPMAGTGRRLGAGSWSPQQMPLSRGLICSCDDGGRCWKLVGPEIKDTSDHGVTSNASGYFVRRRSPVKKWPKHRGTVCLAFLITKTILLISLLTRVRQMK